MSDTERRMAAGIGSGSDAQWVGDGDGDADVVRTFSGDRGLGSTVGCGCRLGELEIGAERVR